jgi:hypothetical protein
MIIMMMMMMSRRRWSRRRESRRRRICACQLHMVSRGTVLLIPNLCTR